MKKILGQILILFSLILAVTLFLCSCSEIEQFDISYDASLGGNVFGELNQSIRKGNNANTVVASPNIGYRFVKWSDGETATIRQDKNIQSSFNATAEFERIVLRFQYTAGTGGSIVGEVEQEVYYGDDVKTVTAVAADGYMFVYWSDGFTVAERNDTGITSDISVNAEFIKLMYTITYTAGAGGSIVGEAEQGLYYGDNASAVTAVPNEGYRFVKWSDGVTTETRQDENIQATVTVTAEFERIAIPVKYSAGTGGSIAGEAERSPKILRSKHRAGTALVLSGLRRRSFTTTATARPPSSTFSSSASIKKTQVTRTTKITVGVTFQWIKRQK